MPSAIQLPELSAADPEIAGEGGIDPLGLAAFADRLAEAMVPHVRARMFRIRFLTAIAVAAVACESLRDEPPHDGVSTPAICFEWLLIEAFARKRRGGELVDTGIPGSAKAASVIAQNQRLNARNYLKTPGVFGFHGIYGVLARSMGIIDAEGLPGERCGNLVSVWAAEQGFHGFLDGDKGTPGGSLRVRIGDAVRAALRTGHCATPPSSHIWKSLADALGPTATGTREAALLRSLLLDDRYPVRAELAERLVTEDLGTEKDALTRFRSSASPDLQACIDAIDAYEVFAMELDSVFETLRYISTGQGATPVTPAQAGANDTIRSAAQALPELYATALERTEPFGLPLEIERSLGQFGDAMAPDDLALTVLAHHHQVQANKPPRGKRPWFEEYQGGYVVRPLYWLGEPPGSRDGYLHPFRVTPLWQFMADTA